VFENVINQDAVNQIIKDIELEALAPSLLFSGPAASGKGTAALELARVLSCQSDEARAGAWNCDCRDCKQHRLLSHPDVIIMGARFFSAEISAAADTFLRNQDNLASRHLFLRSVQKLLARFNPVLWEDDTKISKLNETITKLSEDLDDFQRLAISNANASDEKDRAVIEKLITSITTKSYKLENDGVTNAIPVAQIRRASAWSRLAPTGKRKVLIIEQADTMQDASANSLLKILEEPPENLSIILTTSYPGAILPTLLSRLRPYRFVQRDEQTEREVIRRVFRTEDSVAGANKKSGNRLTSYLDSFLPSRGDELFPLAAYFVASAAASAVISLRRNGMSNIPEYIIFLGKYSAPISESQGPGRHSTDTKTVIATVMKGGNNFEIRSLFPVFLTSIMEIISGIMREYGNIPGVTAFASVFGKKLKEADMGVSTFNQSPGAALEKLFIDVKEILASYSIKEFT
jgi:DNA polymerase-3 subunit gamma/tau